MALKDYVSMKPSLGMYNQASVENPRLGMYDKKPDIYNPRLGMTQEEIGSTIVQAPAEKKPAAQNKPVNWQDWLMQQQRVDLSQDIKRAERDRKMHLFGNMATVLGQGLGSLMGARQFTQVQNNDPYYLQRIDQLRNQQRAYDADQAKQLLTMQYNDYLANQKQQNAYNELALKHAYDLDTLEQKSKYDAENEERKYGYTVKDQEFKAGESEKQRKFQEWLAKYNAGQANYRAGLRADGSGNSNKTDTYYYKDANGNRLRFDLPTGFWNNNGYVTQLYNMLPPAVRQQYESSMGIPGIDADRLSNQQMANAVNAYMTPEILDELEMYSSFKNQRVDATAPSLSPSWMSDPQYGFSPNAAQQPQKKQLYDTDGRKKIEL